MHSYVVALGSNMRHHCFGAPRAILTAAVQAMEAAGLRIERIAPVVNSAPLGPSRRRYANSAVLISTTLAPPALLDTLHIIENAFGRVRRGSPWRARTLDLDVVLLSGGMWSDAFLTVPHAAFRERAFVLGPIAAITPRWRDPLTGLTVKHLLARLTRPAAPPR